MDGTEYAGGLAYRSAGERSDRVVLLVHGYPESAYMWRQLQQELAGAGWWALAPDLPGYGDSEPDPPGTWERHVDALERFHEALGLGRVLLVTHDWGVMIGLRWACDHASSIRGLVISDGGFFADRRWHDLANVMRTPGEGETLIDSYTLEAFTAGMKALAAGMTDDAITEYWKGFADPVRRRAHLELYRSGEFEKLAPYEGKLAALTVPSLILWGANDNFAPVKLGERFNTEIPGSEFTVFPDAGHFVWDDAPEASSERVLEFIGKRFADLGGTP
jgi:haloalkane dehalogenase